MKRSIKFIGALLVVAVAVWAGYSITRSNPQEFAQGLLAQADVQVGGSRPWDITVHNNNLFARVMQQGSLGLGEAYMDGWWDCQALDQFFYKILDAQLDEKLCWNWTLIASVIKSKFMNLQSKDRAFQVGEQHYDLSNALFSQMLDPMMVYSCGYWKDATTLDQAQEDKLELICKKLQLKSGMKMLDIGCGWGGLANYAATHYGVEVTGVTISKEQANYACELCKDVAVKIKIQDYRELNEQFDRIVSVGMFEHVGSKNYDEFMRVAHRCLKDDGLFLLHTIGGNVSTCACDPWITKYIFPNGQLPSMVQISKAIEGLWIMEDWHNFGPDYDKTLMAWYANFERNWEEIKQLKDATQYNERFYRMWKYYLLSCAGLFRARKAQLWQLVLTKKGCKERYNSVR